mmetsp:Transcript_31370/g.88973  ORF Transcript_31370/g.88973 Transcript_31370/m.88973 type:complete len:200 (+) Transcript_31370:4846-5445(+)
MGPMDGREGGEVGGNVAIAVGNGEHLPIVRPIHGFNGGAREGDGLPRDLLEAVAKLDELDSARASDGGAADRRADGEVCQVGGQIGPAVDLLAHLLVVGGHYHHLSRLEADDEVAVPIPRVAQDVTVLLQEGELHRHLVRVGCRQKIDAPLANVNADCLLLIVLSVCDLPPIEFYLMGLHLEVQRLHGVSVDAIAYCHG